MVKFISSDLQGINDLLDGGYPIGIPIGIFGPPATGKTIFVIQESIYLASKLGGSVLYIDTEGGGNIAIAKWAPRFKKRFGDVEIYYKDVRHIAKLLEFCGFKINLRIKSGKIDIYLNEIVSPSSLAKTVESKKIKVIVVDSISNPLKIYFPGGRVNFPARADASKILINSLQDVSCEYDTITFGILHESVDPTNPYERPGIFGGLSILYNFKVLLYLAERRFKPHRGVRDLYLARWFDEEKWNKSIQLFLDSNGYRDISQEELSKLAKRKKEVTEA